MIADYHFARISKDNLDDFILLFESAFDQKPEEEVVFKKFNTSYTSHEFFGYLAYDEKGNPAAYYGVYPCEVKYKGKTYICAQSGDTMTHPDHRGKGLFTTLALKTYELCKQEGIELVFGFPNQNSYPGFIKNLRWTHMHDLNAYTIRVKTIPWVRLKKLGLPAAFHNTWCSLVFRFLRNGNEFISVLDTDENAHIPRNTALINYKTYSRNFLKCVNRRSVWFKYDDLFLIIGDLECENEDEFRLTIKKLKKIAFFCGLPHVRMHVSDGTTLDTWWKSQGKQMENKYPVGGIAFSDNIPLEMLKFTTLDNDTF